jgi:hypothetical protein
MLTYTIVVNDNGELKSISQVEFEGTSNRLAKTMEREINKVLDARSEEPVRFKVQRTVDGGTVVVRSTKEELDADDMEDRIIGASL